MDSPTLALALILVLVTQALVGALGAWRRKDAALTVWASGFTGSALGFLLFLVEGFGPASPFTLLGNTLITSFQILLPVGLAFFLEVPRPWLRYGRYLFVWFVLMLAFTIGWPSYPIRSFLLSAFFVLLTVEFFVLLTRRGQGISPSLRKILQIVAGAFVLFHGIRGVLVLSSQAKTLISDSNLTGTTFLVTIGFSILWGGVLLLLDSERLQKQVSARNIELQRLNALKDRVLAITSHDLRGPMGNLQVLWAELAERVQNGDCGELETDLFQMVDRSLVGTQNLLENLFSFADSQAVTGEQTPTDLSLAISAVVDQCGPGAATKGIEVRREWEPMTLARAGFDAVVTVLRNVVGNAIKFTPAGGSITIRLVVPTGGDEVFLEVQDTGIGMSPEMIEKTLLLNSRLSRPGTAGERGSGFGLVLVKELIENWGGSLRVESSPGQGAKVIIGLPRELS